MNGRRWGSAMAAATLAAGTLVAVQAVGQGTAAAALPGIAARAAQTDFAPAESKTISAECPAGTRVTGGAGRVTGITDHVVLTRLQPVHTNNPGSLDRYTVTAIVDEVGSDAQWAVAAYALCATNSNSLAIQIVSSRSPVGSPQNEREIADCPFPKVALGTGARINGGAGQVHLTEVSMGGSSTGIHSSVVTAQENNDGFGGDWSLDSFAVCANVPRQNHVVTTGFAPGPGSADRKVAEGACPAGMTLTGAGATIQEPFSGRVVLERILPEFLIGSIPGDEASSVAREEIVNNDSWALMVHLACVV